MSTLLVDRSGSIRDFPRGRFILFGLMASKTNRRLVRHCEPRGSRRNCELRRASVRTHPRHEKQAPFRGTIDFNPLPTVSSLIVRGSLEVENSTLVLRPRSLRSVATNNIQIFGTIQGCLYLVNSIWNLSSKVSQRFEKWCSAAKGITQEISKLTLMTRSLTVRATDSPGNDKKLTTLGSLTRPSRMCLAGSIEYPRRGISERRNRRIPSKQKQRRLSMNHGRIFFCLN